jgi:hypothetical protein
MRKISFISSTKNKINRFHFILFCIVSTGVLNTASAQFPEMSWQGTYGGSFVDFTLQTAATSDGGYIMAGTSESVISGNKTVAGYGSEDYWIIKLDAIGNIQWQKVFGGSGSDVAAHAEQTTDGGYIIAGYSSSLPGGNKTAPLYGIYDCWILKLNASGTIEWQTSLGGDQNENCYAVLQTADGGYIVGADSESDISGNKTESSFGGKDYWIIKLNAAGTKIWEKAYGGDGTDLFADINLTSDGGFIIGGSSNSNFSGNKNENTNGLNDFWVLKLNSTGNIDWQNTIGGNHNDDIYFCQQTLDGNYFVGGSSASEISGDKTEAQFGAAVGLGDYYVMKLNASGDIIWQNTIGATRDDQCYAGMQLSDGMYIIGGMSGSTANGDKTVPRIGGADIADIWVLQLDTVGNISSQNVIGGTDSDIAFGFSEGADGGILISALSWSAPNGNKTSPLYGMADAWLIKLSGACIPTTEICNTLDDDCNGLIDDGITETITIEATGATTFCQGENVILNATYSGTAVQWKKNGLSIAGATAANYTATATGIYTCETSSACASDISNEISVTVNKNPKASITAGGPTTFCEGGSVTLTETPVGGATYQWFKGGAAIGGATTNVYVATSSGNYKCRVTKTATGCSKVSNAIAVLVTCKEGEEMTADSWKIAPNPAANQIVIYNEEQSSEIANIVILNAIGEILFTVSNQTNQNGVIDISMLPPGVYFVNINSGTSYQTFIKQ